MILLKNLPRCHVWDETREEGLGGEIGVVLLEQILRGPHELHGDQGEAFGLEAFDDLANHAALDAVGLHHQEGAFHDSIKYA